MDEKTKISKSAKNLLWLAGGHKANIHNYCSVLSGGSDDITGMIVGDMQLRNWQTLGTKGERICYLLKLYGDRQPKAYGCYCYDKGTIDRIFLETVFPLLHFARVFLRRTSKSIRLLLQRDRGDRSNCKLPI